jgi:hypothetical protein
VNEDDGDVDMAEGTAKDPLAMGWIVVPVVGMMVGAITWL